MNDEIWIKSSILKLSKINVSEMLSGETHQHSV